MAAEEMEALARENAGLDGRIRALEEENAEHRERERILKETLALGAARFRGHPRRRRGRRRELTVREAEDSAERLTHNAMQRAAEIEKAIHEPEAAAGQLSARDPEDARALRARRRDGPPAGRAGSAAVVPEAESGLVPPAVHPHPDPRRGRGDSSGRRLPAWTPRRALSRSAARLLATPIGITARRGREQGEIRRIRRRRDPRGGRRSRLSSGREADYRREYGGRPADVTVDAAGGALLPGSRRRAHAPGLAGRPRRGDRATPRGRELLGDRGGRRGHPRHGPRDAGRDGRAAARRLSLRRLGVMLGTARRRSRRSRATA